jgi:hypothetical protein
MSIARSCNLLKAAPAVRPAARLRVTSVRPVAPARKAMSVRAMAGRDLSTSSRPGETLEQTAARRYNESMAVQMRTVVRSPSSTSWTTDCVSMAPLSRAHRRVARRRPWTP